MPDTPLASGSVPLVLFPVRLQVRTDYLAPQGPQLLVRIFPDDIHVAPTLSADVPSARCLPDHFLIRIEQNGMVSEAAGTLVGTTDGSARAIVVGARAGTLPIVPTDATESGLGGVPPPPGDLQWLVDFDSACALGLGVRVPLPFGPHGGGAPPNIEHLWVVGVSAAEPSAAAAQLGKLFSAHHAGDALAIVPQGTPTNNSERQPSGWSRRAAAPTVATEEPVSAVALATAFGTPGVFDGVEHASDRGPILGRALIEAFWDVTWGSFLGDQLDLILREQWDHDTDEPQVRAHAVDFLRARGPLPALRVGPQPYGVLPVTLSGLDGATDPAERLILRAIRALRPLWEAVVSTVPRLPSADTDATLAAILRQRAISDAADKRNIVESPPMSMPPLVAYGGDRSSAARTMQDRADRLVFGDGGGISSFPEVGPPRHVGLPLAGPNDATFVAALIAGTLKSGPANLFQAFCLMAHAATEASIARIVPSPVSATWAPMRQSIIGALHAPTAQFNAATLLDDIETLSRGLDDAATSRLTEAARQLENMNARPSWARHRIASAISSSPKSAIELTFEAELAPAGAVLGLLRSLCEQAVARGRVHSALTEVAAATVDERTTLVGELLDVTSSRLDAWITSIASARHKRQRELNPTATSLGAFGWLHDIVLDAPSKPATASSGYVHALSPAHAVTAGILRSGRLTHAPSGEAKVLDIDLSSTRVRVAMEILQGVRNDQPIGALLGYRLERWLHDHVPPLDYMVYRLRTAAPLINTKLRNDDDGTGPDEALSAANVVDGWRLLALAGANPTSNMALAALLRQPLSDSLYNAHFGNPSEGDIAETLKYVDRLSRVADAVGDLLLAEGVHQFAQGNVTRAAASLDAVARGEAIPPDPAILQMAVPTRSFTYRAMVARPVGSPGVRPPRGRADPTLDDWAAESLDPQHIHVTATRSAANFGWCALDLIAEAMVEPDVGNFASQNLSEPLVSRQGHWPEHEITLAEAWPLARQLGQLIEASRPMVAADIVAPTTAGDTIAPNLGDADLDQRLSGCRARLADIAEQLDKASSAESKGLNVLLSSARSYGIDVSPFPVDTSAQTLSIENRVLIAGRAAIEIRQRLVASQLPDSASQTERSAALRTVFGSVVRGLPVLFGVVEPGRDLLDRPLPVAASPIRQWLARYATVRPAIRRWLDAMQTGEAIGQHTKLCVTQVSETHTVKPPIESRDARWVGLPFTVPPPDRAVSCLLDFDSKPTSTVSGFVVDEWSETVADQRQTVTTGVALHAPTPNAHAPQVILIATTPDGQDWSPERLLQLVTETYELAKLRGVDWRSIPFAGTRLPAIYTDNWAFRDRLGVDWDSLPTITKPPSYITRERQ